jgi:dUTP pyrophosphatase
VKVKFKKLSKNAIIPKYAHNGDAGLDMPAISYEYIKGRHVYNTGLAVEIPKGYVGLIFPRSSIYKRDLRLTNAVGVLDSTYRGEVKFIFEDYGFIGGGDTNPNIYKVGDKIGQIILLSYRQVEFEETQELSSSDRGELGFGSSGD